MQTYEGDRRRVAFGDEQRRRKLRCVGRAQGIAREELKRPRANGEQVGRLFDKGYVTATPDLCLEVSPRLRADYSNGRSYYPLHGVAVRRPRGQGDAPASEFLEWHNQHVYIP